jgi:hypothetical protein
MIAARAVQYMPALVILATPIDFFFRKSGAPRAVAPSQTNVHSVRKQI